MQCRQDIVDALNTSHSVKDAWNPQLSEVYISRQVQENGNKGSIAFNSIDHQGVNPGFVFYIL